MRTAYIARWVIPVTSAPVQNGAVVVNDGRIERIGSAAGIAMNAAAADIATVDLGNVILMPGLINVHAHPELSFLRGALEDLPFHQWIPRLRRIKLAVAFSPDELRDAARWSCAEAAAAGITTIGATEDSDAAMHALRDAGMRGFAFREVFAPAPSDAHDAVAGLRTAVDAMRMMESEMVRVGISPHAPYTVSDDLFRAVAQYAKSCDLPVAVHAAESGTEQMLVTQGAGAFAEGLNNRGIETPPRGTSTIDVLARTGILDRAPLLIHCVHVNREDMKSIALAGAAVAHCPVANARLGHGVAPVPEMIDRGIAVGLGSDSVASNNRIDMLEEARIAQIVQRARLHSPTAMPAETLLRLATIDAARALRIDDRTGSLESGKDADLCAISIDGTHAIPAFDPVAALFMSCRGSDTVMTMVRGRIIFRSGVHHTLDIDRLRPTIDDMGARVRHAAATMPTASAPAAVTPAPD